MISFFLICCAVPIRAGAADFFNSASSFKIAKAVKLGRGSAYNSTTLQQINGSQSKTSCTVTACSARQYFNESSCSCSPCPSGKTAGAKKRTIRPCQYQTVPDRAGARNILLLNRHRETDAIIRPARASPALKEKTAAVRHVTAQITFQTDRAAANMTGSVLPDNIWTILAAAVCLVQTMLSATVRKPGKKSTAVRTMTIYAAARLLSATWDIICRPAVSAKNVMK